LGFAVFVGAVISPTVAVSKVEVVDQRVDGLLGHLGAIRRPIYVKAEFGDVIHVVNIGEGDVPDIKKPPAFHDVTDLGARRSAIDNRRNFLRGQHQRSLVQKSRRDIVYLWIRQVISAYGDLPVDISGISVSAIFEQDFNAQKIKLVAGIPNGNQIDAGTYIGSLTRPIGLICLSENPSLQAQNSDGQYSDNYHPTSPSSDNSRPFGYFAAGIICIAIGFALAWYGAGYERGNKYQATQYIIECAVSFGLIVTACLFAAQGLYLILVFVVGIVERPEARVIGAGGSVVGESQFTAKASDAQPIRAIKIANEADAIEFRPALLNVGVFLSSEDAPSVDVSKLIIQPRSNNGARCIPDSGDLGGRRQHGAIADDIVSKPYFLQSSIGRADVNAPQIHNNGIGLPNISGKPKVFKANLWSMTGEKFVARGLDRLLQLIALPAKHPTKTNQLKETNDNKDAGESYEPQIGIRFGALLGGQVFGFLGSWWGWLNFYNERRLFASALIGISTLLALSGWVVWMNMAMGSSQ
jgi:hypothetical protein